MENDVSIDQDLYSRQLYVLGLNAMKRMAQSNVLIAGLDGLGVELAKNIILAGVKAVVLLDDTPATWMDLSTQFYIREEDIGLSRGAVSTPRLAELNPYVSIRHEPGDLASHPDSFFHEFQAVVLSSPTPRQAQRIDAICRSKGIPFVMVHARGFTGSVFVDFGPSFEINDRNGEEPIECMISEISQANPGVVRMLVGRRHGLDDGDHVRFSEVQGMSELNGKEFPIKVIDPYSFSIGDTSLMSPYLGGGLATEVKMPTPISFQDLSSSLKQPEISYLDFAKMDNPMQTHIGLWAIMSFFEQNSRLPASWASDDADKVVDLAQTFASSLSNPVELNRDFIRLMSFTSVGQLNGITAFLGGVAAQETLKGISGKFTPLHQWMFVDAIEVVPPVSDRDVSQFAPQNDRLDGQRVVIGQKYCDLLSEAHIFLVGSGAIGCEMLKNLALSGVGTRGLVTITDNDLIEKSNLNRQFLFRAHNIGHPKSQSAAQAVLRMNSSMKIEAHMHKVCEETENIYSDSWWSQQQLIINALDNVQARLYTDQRCVKNRVPLLESGTMGTKGHVQVIVPHLTANYGATRDPPEAGIPFCTLKSFPSQIEHCIQWGRDKFNTLFNLRPQEFNQLINEAVNESSFAEKIFKKNPRKKELEHSLKLLRNRPSTLADCVRLAREKFDSLFVFNVEYLLTRFPSDGKNPDGTMFWALPRRMPRVLRFDPTDSAHSSFILHATALYAHVYRVSFSPTDMDPETLAKMAGSIAVRRPNWKNKHIETNEQATGNQPAGESESVEFTPEERSNLTTELAALAYSLSSSQVAASPEEFEKDDDTNHHIDFITASSNIRAVQYGIQPADRLKTKKVAGRIIPAMATSTAAVTGLAALEIVKILRRTKLDTYKNAWMNLALPSITFSEPQECAVQKISDEISFSLWDRWDIQEGDLALGQLLNHFKKKYQVVVTAIIQNTTLVYTDALPEYKKRIPQKISKLLNTVDGVTSYPVTMSFESLDGAEVVGPPVVLHLTKK